MPIIERWERTLTRWSSAGLVSPELAERLRAFEAERAETRLPGWPVLLALGFGGILLASGVLLFVAAHWDGMSPAARFSLVLLLVAAFHAGAAVSSTRSPLFATALHAVGTVCLGAGIFLAAQIFNLEEHWPLGCLLWAAGAWLGVFLLRDWPQFSLAAVLTPLWLASERLVTIERSWEHDAVLAQAVFLLAFVYLTARGRSNDDAPRRALSLIGAFALLPCTAYLFEAVPDSYFYNPDYSPPTPSLFASALALALPVAVGFLLRGRNGWIYVPAALWVFLLRFFDDHDRYGELGLLSFCALGAALVTIAGNRDGRRVVERAGLVGLFSATLGLLWWADKYEGLPIYLVCLLLAVAVAGIGVRFVKKDSINLGVVMFGTTVLFFYSSTVMDKLGRSASLIGLGVLFLAGGFALERTRRRLLGRARGAA
jgi:uncharacterized membrane protein